MGMFFNGANCDIYIGKGAGKKLLNDIENAKESIRIVSPYLSPFLTKQLINLKKRNIDVQLITTDNIKDFYGQYDRNIHHLIIQNRETDQDAVKQRKRWIDIAKILLFIISSLFVALLGMAYWLKDEKIVFGLVPLVVLLFVHNLFKTKIKNKRIFSYWYSQLFPFKVYMSPEATELSNTFVHGKIYLIDDRVAYLGSLNFTASGTKYNYETRIRTTDVNAVNEISNEIQHLFNHSGIPERDIQMWGTQLYQEPIN